MEIKPTQITWDQIPKDWMVQPKYDGECNKLIIKDGTVNLQRFEGRSKTDFYPEIIEEAKWRAGGKRGIPALPDMVVVGEVCVLLDKYRASFPHIQLRMNTLSKVKQMLAMKDKLATFVAFDIEEYKGKNLDKEPYKDRYKILEDIFPVLESKAELDFRIVSVANLKPQKDWKKFVKEHEMEGIVIKNPDKRAEWVKLKNWDEDDFKIIDTELTEEGEARGWFISKLKLEDTKGTHVDKGQQFDCKYINYPQTESAKELLIGKTAIIKYMKMRGRDGQYLAPRHPSLVEILEFEK
jgi:ATP-dependent DNA ligase